MQLSEIIYQSWDKLQRFILDFNEEWSYKSKSKQIMRRNIFYKVDEVSHSFFFCKQKVKGNCADVFKLLKYWENTEG